MKRPRNFHQYESVEQVAAQLRELADLIEKQADFAKYSLSVSIWRKLWDDPEFRGGCLTSATFVNKQSGKVR